MELVQLSVEHDRDPWIIRSVLKVIALASDVSDGCKAWFVAHGRRAPEFASGSHKTNQQGHTPWRRGHDGDLAEEANINVASEST